MALSKQGTQREAAHGYGRIGYLGDLSQGGVREERSSFLATRATAASFTHLTPTGRSYEFQAGLFGDHRITQSYLAHQGEATTAFAFDPERTVIHVQRRAMFEKG